jgi:hypothetical protein
LRCAKQPQNLGTEPQAAAVPYRALCASRGEVYDGETCTMDGMPSIPTRRQELKGVCPLVGVQHEVTSVAVNHLATDHRACVRHSGYVTETLVRLFSTQLSLEFLLRRPWNRFRLTEIPLERP